MLCSWVEADLCSACEGGRRTGGSFLRSQGESNGDSAPDARPRPEADGEQDGESFGGIRMNENNAPIAGWVEPDPPPPIVRRAPCGDLPGDVLRDHLGVEGEPVGPTGACAGHLPPGGVLIQLERDEVRQVVGLSACLHRHYGQGVADDVTVDQSGNHRGRDGRGGPDDAHVFSEHCLLPGGVRGFRVGTGAAGGSRPSHNLHLLRKVRASRSPRPEVRWVA